MRNQVILQKRHARRQYDCRMCSKHIRGNAVNGAGEEHYFLHAAGRTHRICVGHPEDQIRRFAQALREAGFRAWSNGIAHYRIGISKRSKEARIEFIRALGAAVAEANATGREFDASEFAREHGVDKTTVCRALVKTGLDAARPGASRTADRRNHAEIIRQVREIISNEDSSNPYPNSELARLIGYQGGESNLRLILRNAGIPRRSQRRRRALL